MVGASWIFCDSLVDEAVGGGKVLEEEEEEEEEEGENEEDEEEREEEKEELEEDDGEGEDDLVEQIPTLRLETPSAASISSARILLVALIPDTPFCFVGGIPYWIRTPSLRKLVADATAIHNKILASKKKKVSSYIEIFLITYQKMYHLCTKYRCHSTIVDNVDRLDLTDVFLLQLLPLPQEILVYK